MDKPCRCHSGPLYAALHTCPKCGHHSLDRVGDWEGCERRACGYENSGHEQLDLDDETETFHQWMLRQPT